ncbi:MAG: O-antigen polysaccharide polymerase Wzy [Alteromonadaceae bacterium]|nr:O-antigen polysaccharide polymerase Wzy [Alteromonadaceae bacterium]
MGDNVFLYASILLLLLRSVWEFKYFKGKISPLVIYTFCYFYFCFGPYIAFMLDIPIYSGIKTDELFQSSLVFFLAIFALSITPSNFLSSMGSHYEVLIKSPKLIQQTTFLLMAIPVLFVFAFAFMRIGFSPLDKVQRIQLVGILHYVVLTLWPLFLFCYLTVSPFSSMESKTKKQFSIAVLLYFSYCFYMGERDFALIAVPLYFWFNKDRTVAMWKLVLLVLLGGIGFTLMSAGRSSEFDASGLGAFLNQGSNLMVTSNIISWLEHGLDKWWGMSYLSSFFNMITLGALKFTTPLAIWFSRNYSSAANDGAYGFSLEGEVLLNFGVIGVPIVFAIIAILISSAFKGYLNNKPFGTLMTYFILFYFIYAIRGESLIIFKAFIYCCLIFFVLLYISQKGRFYFKYQHTS